VLSPYARRWPARPACAIDRWLGPSARLLERHETRVAAPAAAALEAVERLALRDLPVVRALFALRGIPFSPGMTLREFFGTPPFLLLEEEPARELVFGVVGPLSRIPAGRTVPSSPAELSEAARRSGMAAVGNFRAEPWEGGARLWTETWVLVPGAAARLAFGAYWLAIGPFSAWIRRTFLRAARAKAERRAGPAPTSRAQAGPAGSGPPEGSHRIR
jgi:hypothetical protein